MNGKVFRMVALIAVVQLILGSVMPALAHATGPATSVFSFTNRIKLPDTKKGLARFGGKPSEDQLFFSEASLQLPHAMTIDQIKRALAPKYELFTKLRWKEKAPKFLNYPVKSEDEILNDLGKALQASPDHTISLFIGGSFHSDADHTQELAGWPLSGDTGVPFGFSWASRGNKIGLFVYLKDSDASEESVYAAEYLVRFLLDHGVKPEQIRVRAHSMGNRILARMCNRLSGEFKKNGWHFASVDMIYPDIASLTFRKNYAENVRTLCLGRPRIYISRKDKAIKFFSRFVNGDIRLGQDATPLAGFQKVIVTKVDIKFLGHAIPFRPIINMDNTGLPGPGLMLKNISADGSVQEMVSDPNAS